MLMMMKNKNWLGKAKSIDERESEETTKIELEMLSQLSDIRMRH